MKIIKVLAAIVMTLFLNACDDNKSSGASRVKGNVKILNNEAVLVGDGSFTLKGVSVSVDKYKIFVNGEDYGSVPTGARTVLQVHNNGTFDVYVNDEKRHKMKNGVHANKPERIKNFKH